MTKNYNPIEYIKNKEQEFTKEMINDTLKYQKQYGFKIGENNVAHCILSCSLSIIITAFEYLGEERFEPRLG